MNSEIVAKDEINTLSEPPYIDKQETNHKSNKQMAILSAIGILMVVSAHVGGTLNLFHTFFPYNSFFMPMFIFISGYFFKDKNVETFENTKSYIKKKTIHLLLYYFIYNVIYGIVAIILYQFHFYSDKVELNWTTLFIFPFIDGQQFGINNPAWFIPTLFTVEMAFLLIRKIQLLLKHHSEHITLAITLVISIVTVYISQNINCYPIFFPLLKLGFFTFFFQFGKLYKDKLEQKECYIKNIHVILITLSINLICIRLYNINFVSLYDLKGFHDVPSFLPIVTAITGIWFWLRMAKILTPALGNSKILNTISDNAKSIMTHHIFFMLVINILLYYCNKVLPLNEFNETLFQSNPSWYRYYAGYPQFGMLYLMAGIYGSLLIANIEKKIKGKLKEILNN